MYNFVRSLLEKSNKKNNENKQLNIDSEVWSSLEIQLNVDGTINIVCSWPEFEEKHSNDIEELSKKYALMINTVNKGLFSTKIIETIKNYKSSNYYDILFAQNVYYKILELIFLEESTTIDNEPVVKPSKALKYG